MFTISKNILGLPLWKFLIILTSKSSKSSGKNFQILAILTLKSPRQNILTSKFTRFTRILVKKGQKFYILVSDPKFWQNSGNKFYKSTLYFLLRRQAPFKIWPLHDFKKLIISYVTVKTIHWLLNIQVTKECTVVCLKNYIGTGCNKNNTTFKNFIIFNDSYFKRIKFGIFV